MADDSNRTCVGCGEVRAPEVLERFVYVEEIGLLFDARRKAPGRGAWVCPTVGCLEKALDRGFSRSFKTRVSGMDVQEVLESMRAGIWQRLAEHLRVAIRSGNGFAGSRAVDESMKSGTIRLLLIASDAGGATEKKYRSNAERKELKMIGSLNGAFLGNASARDFVSVFGIGGKFAARVWADIKSLERLGMFEG